MIWCLAVLAVACLSSFSVPAVEAPVAADTWVRGRVDGKRRGGEHLLRVEGGDGAAYLRFDLFTLPPEVGAADVAGATIRLWIRQVRRPGRLGTRAVMEPWSESFMTGRDQVALLDVPLQTATVGGEQRGRFLSIDATDLVRAWVDGTLPNHGIALVAEEGRGSFDLDSKESVRGGHEPELRVALGRPGGGPSTEPALSLRGPEGPPGPAGDPGPEGLAGEPLNPLRLARGGWYLGEATGEQHAAGEHPIGAIYAGAYLWFVDWETSKVTRVNPATGAPAGSFPVGYRPTGAGSDTVSLWVLNHGEDSVTRLSLVDGSSLGTFAVGDGPTGIAFDGASMWLANNLDDTIMKIRASDATLLATYPVPGGPRRIAFDGTSLWITCSTSNSVVKMRPSDGAVLASYGGFQGALGVAWDGSRVWVADFDSRYLRAISPDDGSLVHEVEVGWDLFDVVFDGESIWVPSTWENLVARIRPRDGVILEIFAAGDTPEGIAFDGARVWVTNSRSNTASGY